jgi:hypothetical protein
MYNYHLPILYIFSAFMLVGCGREAKNNNGSDESHMSFTDNGAWCWFSDPRAIHFNGRTYAGWVDSLGNVVVGFYDHKTKYIETRVLHENLEVDDHDNPSLCIDNVGKLLVFYSKHGRTEPETINYTICLYVFIMAMILGVYQVSAQALYTLPEGLETRWASFENNSAGKGRGGSENKTAKGHAFEFMAPGETKVLMDVTGAGLIQRIWLTVRDRSPTGAGI